MKNKTFNMRISENRLRELEFLAEEFKGSKSEIVSELIKSCYKLKMGDIKAFDWVFENHLGK